MMDSYDEDGEVKNELRQNRNADDRDDDDFSMSSYDGDQSDSLVIKPPQAKVLHRDKREKREKRDRHRHKGEKRKDRHRNRDRSSGHEERKRESRRHRKEGEKKEQKRHKERSSKHERHPSDSRKHEKERHRGKGRMLQGEIYEDPRDSYEQRERGNQHSIRGHMGAHHSSTFHRERRQDSRMYGNPNFPGHHISPREKTEREKRMEKFMLAERQKEITQKEVDARRLKREEEKIEELRRRAEASMLRHTGRSGDHHHSDYHRRKKKRIEPETVEIISDEENNFSSNEMEVDEREEEIRRNKASREEEEGEVNEEEIKESGEEEKMEVASSKSSSSSSGSSDSDSSSSSSSDEEDNNAEDAETAGDNTTKVKEEVGNRKDKRSGSRSSGHSSSGDTTEEEKKDSDDERRSEEDDDNYLNESPAASPPEMKEVLPTYFPAIMGCRSVDEFTCLNKIEEGTYGVVYRAKEKSTGEIVALKRLKMEKEKEGFPITSLREVNTLLKGQHENIVTVREIVVGSNMDKIYIVMDYVEHDLKSLMEMMRKKKQSFTFGEIKTLMIQLLRAIRHLHDNWILHRDIKTSNLLLSHRGVLKVGDFGLAREYGSPLKQYTPIVVTLWYRAPELLLGTKMYSCPIDVWSCGCVFGELLGMEPMFPGKSEIDQLNKIFKDLGTPSDKIWPGYSELPVTKKTQFACFPYNHLKERYKNRLSNEGFKLMNSFLTYNPVKRITASEALDHDYFHVEDPAPIAPSMFPTWPAKSENPHGSRSKKGDSPKPPSGGKNFKDLGDGEDENIAGFFLGGAPSSGPGFTLKF